MDRVAKRDVIHQLRERTRQVESAFRAGESPVDRPAEHLDLSELLTGRRLPRGWLIEWQGSGEESGAETLALAAAAAAIPQGGRLVIVDPTGEFYPPGAASLGVPMDERVVVLRPGDSQATWWVWEQVLRCELPIVVWGHVPPGNERQWVRLRWAAQRGGGWGFLLPTFPPAVSTKADVRLLVRPLPSRRSPPCWERRWQVEVLSARGSIHGKAADVVLSHETNPLRLVAELAHSTAGVVSPRGKTG